MITYNINKNDNIQKSDAQEIYDSICKYYRISYHTKILISHVLKLIENRLLKWTYIITYAFEHKY